MGWLFWGSGAVRGSRSLMESHDFLCWPSSAPPPPSLTPIWQMEVWSSPPSNHSRRGNRSQRRLTFIEERRSTALEGLTKCLTHWWARDHLSLLVWRIWDFLYKKGSVQSASSSRNKVKALFVFMLLHCWFSLCCQRLSTGRHTRCALLKRHFMDQLM